jgi:hypothetical protein
LEDLLKSSIQQSAIGIQQSAIGIQHSAISNQHSAVSQNGSSSPLRPSADRTAKTRKQG